MQEEYIYNLKTGWTLVGESNFLRQSEIGHINSPTVNTRNKLNLSPDFDKPSIPIQKASGPKINKQHVSLSRETPDDAIYGAYDTLVEFRKTISETGLRQDLPAIMRVTAMINTFIRTEFTSKFESKTPTTVSAGLKNLYNSFKELTTLLQSAPDNPKAAHLLRSITAIMNKHLSLTKGMRLS